MGHDPIFARSTKSEFCQVWLPGKFCFFSSSYKWADLMFSLTVDVSVGGPQPCWEHEMANMRTETYRSKMGEQKDGNTLGPEGIVALLCQPDGLPQLRFLRTHNKLPTLEAVAMWLMFYFFPLYFSPSPSIFSFLFLIEHIFNWYISFLALHDYGARHALCLLVRMRETMWELNQDPKEVTADGMSQNKARQTRQSWL